MNSIASIKNNSLNLTDTLTLILHEITCRHESFRHIDMNRVLVCLATNRSRSRGATYGKLTPLKFENGHAQLKFRGKYYLMPEIINNGIEQLYILYFYQPKFFDLPFDEKIRVMFHELYHISPEFNGDIRRMGSVKKAHGHSRKHFDTHFLTEQNNFALHIQKTPYLSFLNMNMQDLKNTFNKLTFRKIKVPKPRVAEAALRTFF